MHTNLPRRRSSLSRVGWMECCVRTESQQVPNGSAGSRQWWDVSKIYFFSLFFQHFDYFYAIIQVHVKDFKKCQTFHGLNFPTFESRFLLFTKQHGERRVSKEIYFKITPHWTHYELCRLQWNIFFNPFRFETLRWVGSCVELSRWF